VILPLAGLGLVCWSTSANGGVSSDKLIDTSAKTSTAIFAWGIIAQFNSVMGANSALLVTVPDLARYSKTKNAQLYGQAIGLPLHKPSAQLLELSPRLQSKICTARHTGIHMTSSMESSTKATHPKLALVSFRFCFLRFRHLGDIDRL
jgi:cytosine/uracil/thiamine/allantoin permease